VSRKWADCQICQFPTTNVNHICASCFCVEANIADYLTSEEGRKRILQALWETGSTVPVLMSQEDLDFLKDLANEMRTQNRAGTADPYFYVIQTTKHLPAPPDYGERTVRVDWSGDPTVYRTKEEFSEYFKQTNDPRPEDEIDRAWEELEVFGEHDVIVEDNVFLTKKGYLEHVELNGHNLRTHEVYIKHAWRNPEMGRLIKIIKEIF